MVSVSRARTAVTAGVTGLSGQWLKLIVTPIVSVSGVGIAYCLGICHLACEKGNKRTFYLVHRLRESEIDEIVSALTTRRPQFPNLLCTASAEGSLLP
jgi:hypothetical protein